MSAEPKSERTTLTNDEAWALFDERARIEAGMSGAEFLRRFDAGEFAGRDEPGIIDLVVLLPLARRRNSVSHRK